MSTKDDFDRFMRSVLHRLHKGADIYKDRSWSKDPEVLIDEIEEEVLDICAWSFILWFRLRNIPEAPDVA
jgi:hypothetical protein